MTHQSRIYTGEDAVSRIRRPDEIIKDANVHRSESSAASSGAEGWGAGRKAAPHAQKLVGPRRSEGAGREEAETEDSICLGLQQYPSSPTWSSG